MERREYISGGKGYTGTDKRLDRQSRSDVANIRVLDLHVNSSFNRCSGLNNTYELRVTHIVNYNKLYWISITTLNWSSINYKQLAKIARSPIKETIMFKIRDTVAIWYISESRIELMGVAACIKKLDATKWCSVFDWSIPTAHRRTW